MANLNTPNSFVDGTVADADDVNANFQAHEDYINDRNDGTEAWDNIKVKETGGDNTITLAVGTHAADRTYTFPDAGGAADVVLTAGSQTIAGAKTFSDPITQNDTSNQLVLGTTRTVTITAPTPASSSRTVTIPDLSGDYSVVGTAGAQTINGAKTFGSGIVVGGNTTGDSNLGTISSVTLGKYYEGSFTGTFSGPYTSGTVTFNYTLVGRTVTLSIPTVTGTSGAATSFSSSAGVIPSALRPATEQDFMIIVRDNGTIQADPGQLAIGSTGTISITKTLAGGNFTGSGTASFFAITVTYQVGI